MMMLIMMMMMMMMTIMMMMMVIRFTAPSQSHSRKPRWLPLLTVKQATMTSRLKKKMMMMIKTLMKTVIKTLRIMVKMTTTMNDKG